MIQQQSIFFPSNNSLKFFYIIKCDIFLSLHINAGRDPPKFITSFDAADLYETVRENVRKAGYDRPTPVQKYGIPIIGHGRDLMACAQTGSGKTVSKLSQICLFC